MKKSLLAVAALVALIDPRPCFAEITVRELFQETEGRTIDFAIGSSVEPVYYNDMLNGSSAVGGQFPILYIQKIVSGDFGYLAPFEDQDRGSLAIGASLRVNKIFEYFFADKVEAVKGFLPQRELVWDRLFFGPFVSHSFTGGKLRAGVKAGLRF